MSAAPHPAPRQVVAGSELASVIGEGLHTGLRKGTDAPESAALWRAISESDRAWHEALAFLVDGLASMGFVVTKPAKP